MVGDETEVTPTECQLAFPFR